MTYICKQCNKEYIYKDKRQKFCSRSCAATFNNQGVVRNGETRYCSVCSKKLAKNQKKYCSSYCQWEVAYKTYIYRWQAGEETGISGACNLSGQIERYIREKYKNSCFECGWSEVNPFTNRVPVQIHHINGNPIDNREDNLVLLCPNCHSLEPTLTTNKGIMGRRKLIQEYKNGSVVY